MTVDEMRAILELGDEVAAADVVDAYVAYLLGQADPAPVVTLAEARAQVRIVDPEDTSEDANLTAAIASAQREVELYTGLMLTQREVVDHFDCFAKLELSGWPVAADADVVLTYLDSAGETQFTPDYRLFVGKTRAELFAPIGSTWPTSYRGPGAVTAIYQAGYPSITDEQADLKRAILLKIVIHFERRGATPDEERAIESLMRLNRRVVL